jgi:sortase A
MLLFHAGLALLFVGISGCGGIIEVVPVSQLTPTAAEEAPPPRELSTPGDSPVRIVAETIGLDSDVVEMGWQVVESLGQQTSEWTMPYAEAGWHLNSARPGERSNVVISGHNESTGGQVFAELEELQLGDTITLWTVGEEVYDYQVVDKTIIRTFAISDEADAYLRTVTQPTAEEQLTLITCWPRWTNTHRLIVVAEPL